VVPATVGDFFDCFKGIVAFMLFRLDRKAPSVIAFLAYGSAISSGDSQRA